MEARLLDTNVVSYIAKGDSRAEDYRPFCEGMLLCISPTTLAELYRWPIVRNWSEPKAERLREALQQYTLLPMDAQVCARWAEVVSIKGHPISYPDA
jgi:predicted nucleic acid-binding protein